MPCSVSPILLLFVLFLLELREFVTDEDQIVVLLSLDGLQPTVLQSADADVDIRVLGLFRMILEELRRVTGQIDRYGCLDVFVRLFSVLIALVRDVGPEPGLCVILEVPKQCYDLLHCGLLLTIYLIV